MKSFYKQKKVHIIGLHLLLTFCILFGGHASATTGQGAEVRVAYQNILDATEAIATQHGITGADELFANAREALSSATDEELSLMSEALPKLYQWQQTTEEALLNIPPTVVSLKDLSGDKSMLLSDPFPNAIYHWGTRSSEDALMTSMEIENIALGVQMIADRGCTQVAVVAGFGANGSLVCLVSDAVYIVARFVWTTLERKDVDFTSEEVTAAYLRLGHLHDDFTTNSETVNLSLDEILLNIIANIETINTAHDELLLNIVGNTDIANSIHAKLSLHIEKVIEKNKLFLRMKIENNLARHGQQVHPLGTLILPQAFGGQLELVREIVAETITNMIAAEQKVFFAEAQLVKGNNEFAAGNYKKAYDFYGEAYLSATK